MRLRSALTDLNRSGILIWTIEEDYKFHWRFFTGEDSIEDSRFLIIFEMYRKCTWFSRINIPNIFYQGGSAAGSLSLLPCQQCVLPWGDNGWRVLSPLGDGEMRQWEGDVLPPPVTRYHMSVTQLPSSCLIERCDGQVMGSSHSKRWY